MDFSEVVGQESIKRALTEAVDSKRLSHAYIFDGEKGLGKKTVAKIFANRILCQSNESKCNCNSCQMMKKGVHPDFYVVARDGNSIGVDNIRKMQAQVIIKPMYGKFKVFVVQDADTMTTDAQNALLKTLEEPPEHVVIILCSNNYGMLLDTIKSRAVKYSFKRNSNDELEEYISKCGLLEKENKKFLINYACGNIGKLISLIEDEDLSDLRDVVIDYALGVKRMSRLKLRSAVDFFSENKDRVESLLDIIMLVYRDMIIIKETGDDTLLTNLDKRDIMLDRIDEFGNDELLKDIDNVAETIRYIKQNANFSLSIEVMFLKIQGEC